MKKTRKVLALFLSLIMCVSMLTACGKGDANSDGDATGKGTETTEASLEGTYDITVWCPEAAVALTEKQIDDFNGKNTDKIKFNYTVEAVGEGDAATQMLTDSEAGADIFFFAQDQSARLIQGKVLSKLGKGAAEIVANANNSGVVKATKSGDDMYAYPLTADNGFFMYYDKSVIPESDLDDIDKLIADCEKAGRTFCFDLKNAWYVASFFFGTGCVSEWTTEEGKFVSVNDTFNSDNGLIAVRAMYPVVKSSAFVSSSETSEFAAMEGVKAAVVVSGTWNYNNALELLGDNLGATDLPSITVDGKSYHLGSYNGCKLMGVKSTKDPKRSAALHKLAQYLTSKDAQLERFTALKWGPANNEAMEDPEVKANKGLAALALQSQYSVPQGQVHGSWWDIGKVIATDVQESDGSIDALKGVLTKYEETVAALFNMSVDEAEAFTVIGSICGTNWDTDFEMTRSSETGSQKWYSDALELKAGNELKVRQGRSWTLSFGNGNDNLKVEEDGFYYVKLDWEKDATTAAVTLEKYNPAKGWSAIGTLDGSNWDKDFKMLLQNDGVTFVSEQQFTLKAGNEFKIRQGLNWDVAYGTNGQNFVVAEDKTAYIVFNSQTGDITFT